MRAVGQAGDRLAAAEEEFGARRIADGPPAGVLRQLQQRTALTHRDDVVVLLDLRLGLHLVGQRQRCVAAHRRPADAQHVRARLARAGRAGRRRFGAAGQAEAMNLADHGVAGDAPQFPRDLAGGKPVRPELFEQFDPLVGPSHEPSPLIVLTAVTPAESRLTARPGGRTGLRPRNGTQGTVSYDMSYLTRKTLQYGETRAQESGRLTSTFFV